jgi:hypothetical protein
MLPPLPEKKSAPIVKYDDASHRYWIDGTEVPSVSKLLELTTPKDALGWWGMRVGMAALVHLAKNDQLAWPVLVNEVYEEVLSGTPAKGRGVWRGRGKYRKYKTQLEYLVQEAKLTTNDIKETRGDEGTAIHEAIETIGTHDLIPDIGEFDEALRGYIQGVARWWLEQEPQFHRQEVIVASRRFAYAGRFDLDASTAPLGRALLDFKTSKSIYESHFEQLRLYELAEMELQEFVPKDRRISYDHLAAVHIRKDGTYEVHVADHVSSETVQHLAMLAHARRADAERLKQAKKEAKQLG